MIKLYPDRRWPAFLRVLADTVTVGWTIVWAYLGWLIYQTVMGLEAIADGITNTGTTFNGWIASFRAAVPAVNVDSDPFTIGRSSDNRLQLQEAEVSRVRTLRGADFNDRADGLDDRHADR